MYMQPAVLYKHVLSPIKVIDPPQETPKNKTEMYIHFYVICVCLQENDISLNLMKIDLFCS
jgi:hypothetical protein